MRRFAAEFAANTLHMTVHCKLDHSDNRAFQRHVLIRYRKIHWLYGGLLALILLLTWFGGRPDETVTDKIYVLIGGVVIFGGAGLAFYLVLLLRPAGGGVTNRWRRTAGPLLRSRPAGVF